MFRVRNLRPELRASVMKSTDQTWFGAVGSGSGWRPNASAPVCVSAPASPPRTSGTPTCGSVASLRVSTTPATAGSRTAAVLPPVRATAPAVADLLLAAFDTGTSLAALPSARRPVAGSAPLLPASPAPPLAVSPGLPLFCQHRLQRSDVDRLLGHDVLQLSVLLLQLPQSLGLAQFHAPVLRLPPIETRPRNPVPPP